MNLWAISIRLRSSIHLGESEGGLEGSGVLPMSDTLFSAFCHAYRLLYGSAELGKILGEFLNGDIPFRISSAFPSWNGVDYYPVPLNQIEREKDLKKALWIERKGFEKLIRGEALGDILKDGKLSYLPMPKKPGEEEKRGAKPSKPWVSEEAPRVGLDRRNNHPGERYFQFTQVYFEPTASFFFLVKIDREALWPRLKATWQLLSDEGLGGDRSVGKGLFYPPEFCEVSLDLPKRRDAQVLLSLYYPDSTELPALHDGFYEFIERKGYMYSPEVQSLRRQAVRLLRAGSVIPGSKALSGKLVDVTPGAFSGHRVYRFGIPLTIPCHLKGGNHVD